MAEERLQRISIGFTGGQVLTARVAPGELSRLRDALGADDWHDLTAEDGTVAINLGRVDYLLVDHEGHRVGFGS
jgi:hypothetical protein